MSSLGVYLRGLREAKGVSLDDISRSTRVGRRHLEALESDKLEELPARVFVKGFVRAYCEALEASPDEAYDLLRQTTGEPARAERPTSRPSLGARPRRGGPLLVSAILVLALGGSLFALHLGLKGPTREKVRAASVSPRAPEPVAMAPAAPTTPTVASPSPAPAPAPSPTTIAGEAKPAGSHRLIMRAIEPTWIRVQVDDGPVAEELLQTGAVREWTAARRFVLTVGNAGGLEVDFNGRRIPPLGARGAVIQRLVLPPDKAEAS
jgi:cytoskeleton protein RodZ